MLKHEVGKKLLEARKAMKLTQREVATILKVAQPVYQRYERGIYECNYEQLVILCDLFDISLDYLLGRKQY